MGWQDRAYNRDDTGGVPPIAFKFPTLTRLTLVLMCVNVGLFLLKAVGASHNALVESFGLQFGGQSGWELWRWVTYQYIHASGGHVFFNMLGLYFFLPTLEMRWGWQKALGFYTLGGMCAGLFYFVMVALNGAWGMPLVGASGSVLAAMGAVALLYPARQLIILVFPVPIRVAVALFAGLYLLTTLGDNNFSDAAHLGGLAFGFGAPFLAGPVWIKKRKQYQKWYEAQAMQAEINEQAEVDRILAKVAASGMNSLTSAEKRSLAQASANQRKRDAEREKKRRVKF
jgi:membrane associated rhomboid family serine protease